MVFLRIRWTWTFIGVMTVMWAAGPRGAGAQPFVDIGATLTGVRDCSLAWGDYDGDLDLDLAIAGNASGFVLTSVIYRNNGNDTFADINAGLTGVVYCSLAWADFDGDTDLDLAIAGDTDPYNFVPVSRIYRNNGDDTFTDINAGLLGMSNCSLAWGNYDNDDDPDLAIAGLFDELEDPVTKIYRNNGDGTFTDINADATLVGVERCSLAWGNYNGDDYPDLAIAGMTNGTGTETSKIYRSNGDDTFTDIEAGLTGVTYCSVSWGDYDGDTDLDLAIAGRDGTITPVSMIYRNDGEGPSGWVFTDVSASAGLTGLYACSLSWGDLHNDGERDLAIAGLDAAGIRRSKVYRYEGSDTFVELNVGLTGVSSCSLSWGDYDTDNDPDLAIAGFRNTGFVSKIYRNDGLCGDANGDNDIDSIDNCKDNCVDVPNGPALGTCTAGATGTCIMDTDCDTAPDSGDGVCSADQEDSDGDWVGDVCDNCPFDPNGPNGFNDQRDSDGDGVGDACDICPFTPPEAVVDPTTGCIPNPADFDSDGMVDGYDWLIFEACATGPAVLYDPLPPSCELSPDDQGIIAADLDRDNDVDQSDLGLFQRCMVDDNRDADPNCAG